jgi:hypothetical protein
MGMMSGPRACQTTLLSDLRKHSASLIQRTRMTLHAKNDSLKRHRAQTACVIKKSDG